MQRKNYFKLFLGFLCCFSISIAKAQLDILTPDTLICPGTSATLRSSLVGRVATPVTISDDLYTGVIPLGFSFTFYGNSYSSCTFSSNGYISFDISNAGTYSAWSIASGIPGNTNVLNSILGHYADIYPPSGGTLDYCTVGTAPNRKFVLSFCDAAMFSCTTLKTSFQIILYETTNVIEVHMGNKPTCTSWNSGYGIEGVQNASGTDAVVVPGRNYPSLWTANHDAYKFSPIVNSSSQPTYSVSPIPYAPVPNASVPVSWYANGTLVGTGTNITVNPNVTTTYYAKVINCSDTLVDSVVVTVGPSGPNGIGPNIDSGNFVSPTYCGNTDGYIRLYGLMPNSPHIVTYNKNGVPATPITLTPNSQGVITISNLNAGVYDHIKVKRGICISNEVGPFNLVDPKLISDFNYTIKYGCAGDTVIFNNLTTGGGPVYQWRWNFGDGNADTAKSPTHKYLAQGVYPAKLVAKNQVCADSTTKNIDLTHPILASFTVSKDSICQLSQTTTFTSTSTATGPSYLWNFGDGTALDTNASPTHAYPNSGIYQAQLIIKDFVPCYDTSYHTIVVDSIPFVNFTTSDTVLCEGQGITFEGDYLAIGNTGIQWSFGDGISKANVNPAPHAFDSSGTYTVKLTAHYRLCPDTSISKNVVIKPYPVVNLGPDTTICPNGSPIPLYNHYSGNTTDYVMVWNTGDSTSRIFAKAPGTYYASANLNGCINTDSIEVLKDCYIDIPNSFTPNGDGANDYFFPRQFLSRSVTTFKMSVFNRWGQTIFESTSINGRGWDGRFNDKDQPEGVYVYLIDVAFENGAKEHYQGNVTLLR